MSASATQSLVAPPTLNANSNISRRSANYHPSIWGNHFIQYVSDDMEEVDEVMKNIIMLKEKVRKKIVHVNEKSTNPLMEANLIDSIQRLGLCHHFEQEIGEVLQRLHNKHVENGIITLDVLHSVAFLFRLLRQQGYHILPDSFKKFKNEQGNFSEAIIADVEGMLSLYEATHLRIHGEDILDEALAFTSSHLKITTNQLSPSLVAKVNHSLKRPLFHNMPRLVARHYISTYEEDPSHDANLLLLAKLDFNVLQKQHQKEAGNISKWWKDLDFATKLPFARNRIIEAYFWVLGVYFEPQYSLGRRLVTKVISLASTIDDMYDVYGTLEELQLFTEAIERWNINCMEFLPEYMKFCYKAVLDVYEEIEQETSKERRPYCVTYVKNEECIACNWSLHIVHTLTERNSAADFMAKMGANSMEKWGVLDHPPNGMMIRLVQAYFAEARWLNNNYIPTVEEYMSVALISSGYYLIASISFIGLGSIATEDTFQWLAHNPKIVKASSIICRLMDDIVSNEFEQERGHCASSLECYMNQHGVSREDAINELSRQVTNAWKDINEELLNAIEVPKPVLIRVLNLSRVIDVLYKDGDCYTHSEGSTKNDIIAILVNPWPV